MIACPVCPDHSDAKVQPGSNCFRCPSCEELVFAVKNPFNPAMVYAAISNASSKVHSIPDDILLQRIIDQSLPTETPRNIIIEFDSGASALIIQPATRKSKYTNRTRKSLDKTTFALKRNVLLATLPIELMEQIRNLFHGNDVG